MVLAHFSNAIFHGAGPQIKQHYCIPRWSHICLNFRLFPKSHKFSPPCSSLVLLDIVFLRGIFLSHFSPGMSNLLMLQCHSFPMSSPWGLFPPGCPGGGTLPFPPAGQFCLTDFRGNHLTARSMPRGMQCDTAKHKTPLKPCWTWREASPSI